ncbi:MAG: hypothetical protein A2Y33_16345 [Spirochaetes bacterium GWF1_51_8]|nr:MAG: hypothetical protein A2Y33_16345 [Spirochaetes bacterium GWF1_51_8]
MNRFFLLILTFCSAVLTVPAAAVTYPGRYILEGEALIDKPQAEFVMLRLQGIEDEYQLKVSIFLHKWDGKESMTNFTAKDYPVYNEYNKRGRRAMFILLFGEKSCEWYFDMRPENMLSLAHMTSLSNLIAAYPLSNSIAGVVTNFTKELTSALRDELFLTDFDKFLQDNNRILSDSLRNIGFLVFLILLLISAGLFIFLTLRNFKRFPFLILFAVPVIVLQIYRVIPDFLAVIAYFLIFGFELFNSRTINKK